MAARREIIPVIWATNRKNATNKWAALKVLGPRVTHPETLEAASFHLVPGNQSAGNVDVNFCAARLDLNEAQLRRQESAGDAIKLPLSNNIPRNGKEIVSFLTFQFLFLWSPPTPNEPNTSIKFFLKLSSDF